MGEPEGYDEVMLDTHRDKWKELIVDIMSFVEVWHAGSLSKVPPLEVHLAPWLEGEFVGLLLMFQPKAHGLILLGKELELFSLFGFQSY